MLNLVIYDIKKGKRLVATIIKILGCIAVSVITLFFIIKEFLNG